MGFDIQWPLVLFTLVAGVGGGLLVPMGIYQLRHAVNAKAQFPASVVSLVCLVLGGCFSLLHLASPQNVMAAVFNIFSFSGISIELILLGICFIIALVWIVAQKKELPATVFTVLAIVGIVFGVLLLFFCGHGYVMVSRPAWDTDLLPFAYLGTALMAGVFAYGVILGPFEPTDEQIKMFKLIALGAAILCALSCICYGIAVLGYAQAATPVVFWGGVVLCGIVLAIMVGGYVYRKADAALLMKLSIVGLVIAVIAVLAVRVVMWDTSEGYLELFSLAGIGAPVVP